MLYAKSEINVIYTVAYLLGGGSRGTEPPESKYIDYKIINTKNDFL